MKVVMYGADWCSDCGRAKRFLDSRGIDYEYKNIQKNPEFTEEVVEMNVKAGRGPIKSIPVIMLNDRKVLIEPSNDEMEDAFSE